MNYLPGGLVNYFYLKQSVYAGSDKLKDWTLNVYKLDISDDKKITRNMLIELSNINNFSPIR